MTTATSMLKAGRWFMHPVDQPIPAKVSVYERSCDHRKRVGEITRQQAIAFSRWHGHPGVYFSYQDGNGKWIDVRVVGDVDAWLGEVDNS